MKHIALALALFVLTLPFSAGAQEYRATLVGVVTDQSGAAIPEASLTVTNLATGVVTRSQTSASGNYVVPFLLPGSYRLQVQRDGFKAFERGPIQLRVNDRMRIDAALEVGGVQEVVTVTAEAPLVETATGNRGQVIDTRTITDLPLGGKNPFVLAGLTNGVQFTGNLQYARPFDIGSASSFAVNGGRAAVNEYQIDGVSDNVLLTGPRMGYVPPAEATQEFKVQTSTYDAQYGRTGGGIISVSVKPGTNDFHGAAYDYLRRTGLEANSVSNKLNGKPRTRRVADQYGFEIDGPLTLPKLYNGKNRTFFMFAFEKYRESLPFPAAGTLPTAAQRDGDFSSTFNSKGQLYTIYDPLTVALNPSYDPAKPVSVKNPQYVRQPFAGNQVPRDRMQPIALRVLQDIPLPNQPGDSVTGANNWYAGNVAQDDDYKSLIARVDHTFSDHWKAYARWMHSFRDGGRIDYWGWGTPATQQIHGQRGNDGAVIDLVGTLDASTIVGARLGFNRFENYSVFTPQDVSGLGFPKSLAAQLQIANKYPQFKFENYMQTGIDEWDSTPNESYSSQLSLTKIRSNHSLKAGLEYRLMHNAVVGRVNAAGTYSFTRGWTSAYPQVDDPVTGNAIASFLLGDMSAASAGLNAAPYLSWRYPALYLQDDWQVNRRLTLNLGLRWDYETAPVERYNRQNRGFDPNAPFPIQPPGLDLKGGLLFAGNGRPRTAFDPDRNNWQPRLGLAYRISDSHPLAFRAGVARYFLPASDFGGTVGFSQSTDAVVSTPDYLPFAVLSNPFPGGLMQPAGASLGIATNAGTYISFSDPSRRIPDIWQFSAGFQYEAFPGLLIDVSYAGSRTCRLAATSKPLNFLTADQLALGTQYLSTKVANPFYKALPANTPLGAQATIQRRSLLVQYPQFTSVTMNNDSIGKSWYNSLQLKVQRRFKHGLSVLASYTVSKTMEAVTFKNAQDEFPSRELVSFDVPQRLVLSGFYELPIGPRHRLVSSGLASHLIGGWQVSWSGTFQSGMPMPLPDYDLTGNPRLSSGQNLNHWFDTTVWKPRSPDTLRVTSLYSPNIRRHSAPQLDLSLLRSVAIREGHSVQLKASAYNSTNTPIFNFPDTSLSSPRFGMAPTTQYNSPRSVELGVRYAF